MASDRTRQGVADSTGYVHRARVQRGSLPRFGKIMLRAECSCRWHGDWYFAQAGAVTDRQLAPTTQRAAADARQPHRPSAVIATCADLRTWWRRARHRWLCRWFPARHGFPPRPPVYDTHWRLVCPTCRVPTQELYP